MQLERLSITNVGPFAGNQEFELAPRVEGGIKRSIVLFGGLNGAGKTTFLTAIRLALYGRQSLQIGVTQKQYEEYLRDLIHRSNDALVRPSYACVSLEFTYARLGVRTTYRVLRSWNTESTSVVEHLRIFKDSKAEEILNGEQAQAFLNQLIPSGISQFFFFDGEKIGALASDDSDAVLADAIRRLLGLDLADRLSSDLSVLLRNRRNVRQDKNTQQEIQLIELELNTLQEQIDMDTLKLEMEIVPALDLARTELERRKNELLNRGGAWAVDRNELGRRLEELLAERRSLEDKLRDQLSGVALFTLAPKLSKSVIFALEQSQLHSEQRALSKSIVKQASVLKARLSVLVKIKGAHREVKSCVDDWVAEIAAAAQHNTAELEFGLSDTDAKNVIASLSVAAPTAQHELANTYSLSCALLEKEQSIQEQLVHAPSDGMLKEAFDALTAATKMVLVHQNDRKHLIEEMRRKMWASIELTRKLKKLYSAIKNEGADLRGENIAETLQELIVEFKTEAAKAKCELLKHNFVVAFTRLSRKGNIVHSVRIDPVSFAVTLLDKDNNVIPKKRLSAGEMQIYAIAMLEGLAKSSGRSLPIIIDTPLGRLDSEHRKKLVESYFPTASHQVIVLSTDTEVDRSFYDDLQPYISHDYHLTFDEGSAASHVKKGYFWSNQEGNLNAA